MIYLICPSYPENWKSIEEIFRKRWNVLHTVGALDGKHIAIKKPKKPGSEYFNYKGYFSLVLLALVDAENKFLWVNVGLVVHHLMFRYSTIAQLRIENGTLGLPTPEPLGPGGQIYTTSSWGMTPLPLCLDCSSPTAEDN